MPEGFDMSAVLAILIFVIPMAISFLKKKLSGLDGPAAYWVALFIQILVGILAWATGSEPTIVAEGVGAGLATSGVYQFARRTGMAKGSKERKALKASELR